MHEWAIIIVPRDFNSDYNKYSVDRLRKDIEENIDLGSNPTIELVDLVEQTKETERLKKKVAALERKLNA